MREPRDQQPSPGQQRTDKAFHHENKRPGKPACQPHLGVAKFPKIMALPEVFFCSSKDVSTASIKCVVLTTNSTRHPVSWDEATRKHFHQPLISTVKLMGKSSASADV